MSSKITPENLAGAVRKVLEEYGREVGEISEATIKQVANKGRTALKNESLSMFAPSNLKDGRYGTGWTVTMDGGRTRTEAVIHNYKYPGLPHLLEDGHRLLGVYRGRPVSGFVPGRPHIEPVRERLTEELEREIERKLS